MQEMTRKEKNSSLGMAICRYLGLSLSDGPRWPRWTRLEKNRSAYKLKREDSVQFDFLDNLNSTKRIHKLEATNSLQQGNLSASPAVGECSWVIIEWIPPRSYESSRA